MRSKLQFLSALVVLVLLAVPAMAIFGPPSETFVGRVNFIQQTNFSLITQDNRVVRIMVAQDRKIPSEVQLGVLVEVRAVQGDDNLWYLDKFERIQLQPNG